MKPNGVVKQDTLKNLIDDAAAEYICPITTELPLNPVIAEDGRVYERTAIECHMNTQGGNLKSPVTNEPMGRKLVPAVQVQNTIKLFISSGVIGEEKSAAWKERKENTELVEETRRKAEIGDSDRMVNLGRWYFKGGKGLTKDRAVGYQWLKKASDMHNVRGMAWAGMCLMNGVGTEKNEVHGMNLITVAACRGSEYAAQCLGKWYKNGDFGIPKRMKESKYWLEQIVDGNCLVKDLTEIGRGEVIKLMKEIDSMSEDG
eukprot:CAMPEP_0194182718 /NCGR_PEP_ID=MMETSP0154-20130528/26490_1 /TAXON_ID=1049557 /ORGANISM="Thalassiothrix antarctica, Strain L6-D1" /LENGTH=258 /DNA_ID=CAMNT_0038899159 /DNA_START=118 /DNA_END=891 /DNA_ORIENTATION=-